MSDTWVIDIWNGTHHGTPIGYLPSLDGGRVPVWGSDALSLSTAAMEAIGPIPQPPEFGLGGEVVVVQGREDSRGNLLDPPQVVYNPAGDVINQAKAQEFASTVAAWNQRAQSIQALIQGMLPK